LTPGSQLSDQGRSGIKPPPANFGHFCAEVPKSLHIGAYPCVLLIATGCRAATKSLQAARLVAVLGARHPHA
jgi:hypothetical protein